MKKTVLMAAMIVLPLGLAACDKKAEAPKAETPKPEPKAAPKPSTEAAPAETTPPAQ